MTITRDTVDEIRKNVIELTKTYAEALGEQFSQMGPGMRRMSNDEFVVWFIMKAEENPNWVLALPYVEGGMDELRRWERDGAPYIQSMMGDVARTQYERAGVTYDAADI